MLKPILPRQARGKTSSSRIPASDTFLNTLHDSLCSLLVLIKTGSSLFNSGDGPVGFLLIFEDFKVSVQAIPINDGGRGLTERKFFQSSTKRLGEKEIDEDTLETKPCAVEDQPSPLDILKSNRIDESREKPCQSAPQLEVCNTT